MAQKNHTDDVSNPALCFWCGMYGEPSNQFILISHHQRLGIEYHPESDITATQICPDCVERLAEKGARLRDALELPLGRDEQVLARQMVHLIDTVNSEPPGRDWEDTFP